VLGILAAVPVLTLLLPALLDFDLEPLSHVLFHMVLAHWQFCQDY
jgi:hypothetical protein